MHSLTVSSEMQGTGVNISEFPSPYLRQRLMEFITSETHRATDFFKGMFKSMTEERTEHTLVFVWAPSYFLILIKISKD